MQIPGHFLERDPSRVTSSEPWNLEAAFLTVMSEERSRTPVPCDARGKDQSTFQSGRSSEPPISRRDDRPREYIRRSSPTCTCLVFLKPWIGLDPSGRGGNHHHLERPEVRSLTTITYLKSHPQTAITDDHYLPGVASANHDRWQLYLTNRCFITSLPPTWQPSPRLQL